MLPDGSMEEALRERKRMVGHVGLVEESKRMMIST